MSCATKNASYHLLVHHSFVIVYAVQLVFEHKLRQGVIEDFSGEQCHDVRQRGSDVSWSFKVKDAM